MKKSKTAGAPERNLDGFEVRGYWMSQNLPVELFAKDDDVLKMLPRHVSIVTVVVPNLCLAQESKACHMNDAPCRLGHRFRKK
jgi:hypothetical protein